MKTIPATLAAAAVVFSPLARAADNTLTPAENAEGWVLMFDGKTLGGWKGRSDVWRVEDGQIVGQAQQVHGNTFLVFDQPFSDFHFQTDAKLVKRGSFPNSGIQYRSRVVNRANWVVHGYQADIGDGWWGALYEEGGRGILFKAAAAATRAVRDGDWNRYEILAQGAKLKHILNGVVSGQLDDQDPKARKRGVIALQYHGPGQDFEIRFKNLKIKNLAPTEETAAEEK